MSANRSTLLLIAMLALLCLAGCSDDDGDPVDPGVPEDPRVATVAVDPESSTLSSIGADTRFEATAFDQYGSVIDTVFTWHSSNENVVVVGQDGVAVATGLGTAEIHVIAGAAADTAGVTVTIGTSPVREWIAGGSGDWHDPANWSDNQVPGPGDLALITAEGEYTVFMARETEVEALVLGAGSGSQTLAVQGTHLVFNSGGMYEGANLDISGSAGLQGDFVWLGGVISGSSSFTVRAGAELHALGNPLELRTGLLNQGTLHLGAGASLRINEALECTPGSLFELQGDASVTVQNNGSLTSPGTVHKSTGAEEARIVASSLDESHFSFTGSILVDEGVLYLSGGSLGSSLDIASDAMLRQSGRTEIRSLNMRGQGPLVIEGQVTLGYYDTQIINVPYLILDASSSYPSVSGPANLLIDYTFIWREGRVVDLGSLNTQNGSRTTFDGTGRKELARTEWSIIGSVAGDSNANLTLHDGAVIRVENAGRWLQTAGVTVSQGEGDAGLFEVIGEFHKTGEGAFTVETGFLCSGTLNLPDGTLTVQGDFELAESGVITGGGTNDIYNNRRLILIDAPSAVMRGTIRPDLAGQPARLDIQGTADLEETFTLELDVVTRGDFNTESVAFLTSGQVFGGTLALNVLAPATPEVDYKVVYGNVAQGEFEVTGREQFGTIIQDGNGVVCRR